MFNRYIALIMKERAQLCRSWTTCGHQPWIHWISHFLVVTGTCTVVIQTAASAFDGVAEMCPPCVCCLLSVWSRDNEHPEWRMSSGWHPPCSDTRTQQLAVWLPFVTQTHRCDPRTKAAVCAVISGPKLIFLIAVCCVSFVANMSGLFTERTSSFVWNNKDPE